jgi:hypothetical protein
VGTRFKEASPLKRKKAAGVGFKGPANWFMTKNKMVELVKLTDNVMGQAKGV